MDVFAVEWRHEGPVDPLDNVTGQVVTFVLENLDFRDVAFELRRVLNASCSSVAEPVSRLATSPNMS